MTFSGGVRRFAYRIKERDVIRHKADITSILDDYVTGQKRVAAYLDECLAAAASESPFYRQFSGKPLAEFPVITKLDLIANREAVINPRFAKGEVHTISTSGSTGVPFAVEQDLNKRRRVLAELKVFGERGGYRSHEKMLFFRAQPKKHYWKMFWSNVWLADIASMSDAHAQALYRQQNQGQLSATAAYASTYDILTRKWLERGYAGNPSVKSVFSGSEILTDEVRERCRLFWPNAEVYSRYSNQEHGVIGQEQDRANEYEINWASYFVEILKLDCDQPAAHDEVGRIVVTDLFNRAFPMIRYDTGDLGAIRSREGEWPVLSSVEGRRVDQIYDAAGRMISPHFITKILWVLDGVRQWQFAQTEQTSYQIRYIPIGDADLARTAINERLPDLRSVLGEASEFSIEKMDAIPCTASGKYKPIVQKMNNVPTVEQ